MVRTGGDSSQNRGVPKSVNNARIIVGRKYRGLPFLVAFNILGRLSPQHQHDCVVRVEEIVSKPGGVRVFKQHPAPGHCVVTTLRIRLQAESCPLTLECLDPGSGRYGMGAGAYHGVFIPET